MRCIVMEQHNKLTGDTPLHAIPFYGDDRPEEKKRTKGMARFRESETCKSDSRVSVR